MEIILDLKASDTKDILDTLFVIENKDFYDEMTANLPAFVPDKSIEKYIESLIKNKSIDREKLKFYFHNFDFNSEGDIFTIGDCLDINNIESICNNTMEEYLDIFRNRDETDILQSLVAYLVYRKEKQNYKEIEKYKNLHKDKSKILELLKGCNIAGEAKWSIYLIVSEPKKYLNDLFEFIEGFIPIFNSAIEKLRPARAKFNEYILDKIENQGIEYLKRLPSLNNLEKYKRIVITPMSVNYASIIVDERDEILRLYVGMKIEKALEDIKGKNDAELALNIIKTISDISRFNILKMILSEERFGLEIAEKLGLTNATISHHINLLLIADLVTTNKRDGKVYYKVNKDALRNMVNFITKEFKL